MMFLDQQITLYHDWKRENKIVQSLNIMAAGTHYHVALDNLVDNTTENLQYNIIKNLVRNAT